MSVLGPDSNRNAEDTRRRINLMSDILQETDIRKLARYIAVEQSEYTYDPCGKSGARLERHLSDLASRAVCRLHELLCHEHLSLQ